MEWIDGNIGSKANMKYPACYLMGPHAKGEALSVAFAAESQHQDTGAKMVHKAPYTSSTIVSKSISQGGGALRTAAWSPSVRMPITRLQLCVVTLCSLTTSRARTPIPTTTSVLTRCRWLTRLLSPR